jgi:hypothetical protein
MKGHTLHLLCRRAADRNDPITSGRQGSRQVAVLPWEILMHDQAIHSQASDRIDRISCQDYYLARRSIVGSVGHSVAS